MRVVLYDFAAGSLGVQYLNAALNQAGHEALVYYDISLSREYVAQALPLRGLFSIETHVVCREIMELRPDLVGVSMNSYSYAENLGLIKRLKQEYPGAVVVCGGVHVTMLPHVALGNPEIDFIVVGEGELALARLADALSELSLAEVKALSPEKLPGVWNVCQDTVVDRGAAPLVTDLDTLPFPEKSQYERVNGAFNRVYTISASRGCTYGCTYCNSPSIKALYRQCGEGFHRVRSVGNIIAELRAAVERHRPRYIEFVDDLFGADPEWLREFSGAYKKEIGLPYCIQTSPLLLSRGPTIQLLAESGCAALEIGFQSANEEVRRTILNRHEKNARVREAVASARAMGIFVVLDFIVDLPGETPAHLEEILEFIRQSRPEQANISFLKYFPGTAMLAKALQEGRVSPAEQLRIERGEGFGNYRLPKDRCLQYRVLPFHVLFAQLLPPALSRRLSRVIVLPGVRAAFGLIAGPCVYLFHLWIALFDRRAYFLRGQIANALCAMKEVVRHKLRGGGPPVLPAASPKPHAHN